MTKSEDIELKQRGINLRWGHTFTLTAALITAAMNYQNTLNATTNNANRIDRVEAAATEHLKKLDTAIEAQHPDRMEVIVQSLAASIQRVADAQRADHDILLRTVAALDAQARRGRN